jgi:muramoyltetrapeptide carboxypeptidase LdcA involved in peptidoglycan recycling
MIYPEFLHKGSTIGISAPSAGVGRKLEDFDRSLSLLKKKGWQIKETASVRLNDVRGGDAKTRGEELTSLFKDNEVDFVMAAAGGDFLNEMLEYVNWNVLKKNPKWLMGASDPTGLLFPYTTLYDVATIYGANACSFDIEPLPKYLKNNLEIISGNLIIQKSFSRYMKTPGFLAEIIEFDTPVRWKSTQGDIHVNGRCIGGCIDVLKDMIGTVYDGTKTFKNRYAGDGLIWYFDNFSLSAESLYRTFLQMRYAGWIDPETTKAVLMGRTLIESSDTGMTYEEGIRRAFPDIPVIWEADVGHTVPHFFMVNGAMLDLGYENGKCRLKFRLE